MGSLNRAGQSAAIQRNIAERNRQLQNERIRRELEQKRRAYKKGFATSPQKLQELRRQNVGVQKPVQPMNPKQKPIATRPVQKKGFIARILGK